jgi:hypothetical protein
MAEGYTLSAEFLRAIRGLLERTGQMSPVDAGRPLLLPGDDLTTPEVYVALTPGGGIPALATDLIYGLAGTGTGTGTGVGGGNTPGSADCQIYRVLNTEGVADLTDAGFTRTVHNLSTTAIAGGAWVLAVRDKWGIWWAIDPAGGGGSGGGTATGYRPEEYYRRAGTWVYPAAKNTLYYAGHPRFGVTHNYNQWDSGGTPTAALAMPFLSVRGGREIRLSFELGSLGSSGCLVKLGVYANASDSTLLPGALLYQSADEDVSSGSLGLRETSDGITLADNTLYWIAITTAEQPLPTRPTYGLLPFTDLWPILGVCGDEWESLIADGMRVTGRGWIGYNTSDGTYTELPDPFDLYAAPDQYLHVNDYFGPGGGYVPALSVRYLS